MAKEKAKRTKRPTAEKRELRNKEKRLINKAFKSRVLTAISAFKKALTAKENTEELQSKLNAAYSCMDQGVKRGIFKLNKASRIKARLTAKMPAQPSAS